MFAASAATYRKRFVAKSASAQGETRLNDGSRVLLPYTALDEMSKLPMVYPLQFRLTAGTRTTYAAVLEFSAELGVIVLPDWMFATLQLRERGLVMLETCSLDAGSLVKLRPHKKEFVTLIDPRHVLEQRLVNYPILTRGTTIVVRYAGNEYAIDVVEIYNTASRPVEAVLTIRADAQATELKVEFERPLDMPDSPTAYDVDDAAAAAVPAHATTSANVIGATTASGMLFGHYTFTPPTLASNGDTAAAATMTADAHEQSPPPSGEEATHYTPFAGTGHRLREYASAAAATTDAATTAAAAPSPEQLRDLRLRALARRRAA